MKEPLYSKEVEKRFGDILTKIKKGNLSKEEKVLPAIPKSLESEISKYESMTLEDNQWVEGWKPESLAFRYFNILQLFKTKY